MAAGIMLQGLAVADIAATQLKYPVNITPALGIFELSIEMLMLAWLLWRPGWWSVTAATLIQVSIVYDCLARALRYVQLGQPLGYPIAASFHAAIACAAIICLSVGFLEYKRQTPAYQS